MWSNKYVTHEIVVLEGEGGGGGVYSVGKLVGGMPRAAENWTLKDRGKNEIWVQKDLILEGLEPKEIILVLVDG